MHHATRFVAALGLALTMSLGLVAPAYSQVPSQAEIKRRQEKKNEWRNIGIASAALGIWGLLKDDKTLVFAGTAGALYSAHRYEQDRKSHSKMRRLRAQYFARRSFVRNGYRYVRKTTWRNGKKYYYFARMGRA